MKNLNKEIKLPKIIHTLGDKYQLSNFDKNLLYVKYIKQSQKTIKIIFF